jgi:hypothetical protein
MIVRTFGQMAHQPKAHENRAGLSELHQGHRLVCKKISLKKTSWDVRGAVQELTRQRDAIGHHVGGACGLAGGHNHVTSEGTERLAHLTTIKDHRDCVPAMWS